MLHLLISTAGIRYFVSNLYFLVLLHPSIISHSKYKAHELKLIPFNKMEEQSENDGSTIGTPYVIIDIMMGANYLCSSAEVSTHVFIRIWLDLFQKKLLW